MRASGRPPVDNQNASPISCPLDTGRTVTHTGGRDRAPGVRDVGKDPAFDDRPAAVAQSAQRQLVGNRWALAGAIMYLLEWVAIVGVLAAVTGIHGAGPGGAAGVQIPTATGTKPADIFSGYTAANAAATALSAGWYGLVLPGRILLIAGIRQALRRSWGDSALADLAVAAMALSVLMEIASYWVAAGVGQAATSGADQSAAVTGHAIASMLNVGLFSPLGLSILRWSCGSRECFHGGFACWGDCRAQRCVWVASPLASKLADSFSRSQTMRSSAYSVSGSGCLSPESSCSERPVNRAARAPQPPGRPDSSVYGIHSKANMNASAPIEPTRAWPMWIHVVMRLVIGVMSGSPARKNMCASSSFRGTLPAAEAHENPAC